jgi:hypothetical protein
MTTQEFNEKYKDYLEEGHYGLSISYPAVITYLDAMFKELIKIPGFEYSQIKIKFDSSRFYTNLGEIIGKIGYIIEAEVEKHLNFLLTVENELIKRKTHEG